MQVVIELALHAAQAIVIGADVPQDLSSELLVGIVPLELFLGINALKVESLHPRNRRRIKLARNPREISRGVQARRDLRGGGKGIALVDVHDFGEGRRGRGMIGDF